jgi:hypothetical protein
MTSDDTEKSAKRESKSVIICFVKNICTYTNKYWRLVQLKYLFSRRSPDVSTSRGTTGQSVEHILMACFALGLHQYSRLSQKSLSTLISSHIHYVHRMDRYSIIRECLDDDNYRYAFHFNHTNIQLLL